MRALVAVMLAGALGCRAGATSATEPSEEEEEGEDDEGETERFEGEPPPYVPQHLPEPEPLPLPTRDLPRAYELADQAYNLGEYAKAIGYFKSMYELEPHPELLFNIGQSMKLLGDCFGAVKYFRLYLEAAPAAKNRDNVEAKLEELLARCPDDA